jgi:hypothetical protein
LLAVWQLALGLWSKTTLRLAYGGLTLLWVANSGLTLDSAWATHLGLIWCAVLPLYCRDAFAIWLRATGPFWIAALSTVFALNFALSAESWLPSATVLSLCAVGVAYWAKLRIRWYLAATVWSAALSIVVVTNTFLATFDDVQLRRGLTWYAVGLGLLVAAITVSFYKACFLRRAWAWLQCNPTHPSDSS